MRHIGRCEVCGRALDFETREFLSYTYLTCNIARVKPKHSPAELREVWEARTRPRHES